MKTAVAILNWNGLHLLTKFLPSIVEKTPKNIDIYIIDNGSTDGSVKFIENRFSSIKTIKLEKKMLEKYFPVVIGINADAATATNQIYNEIKKQKIKLDIKDWTNSYLKERKDYLINRDRDNQIGRAHV